MSTSDHAERIAALPDLEAAYLDLYDEVTRLRDRVLELNRETLKGNEE